MKKNFENKLQLGNGIYTTSEIAHILRVPYGKVHLWITKYWDGILGKAYENNYSWSVGNTRAVGFHTLVEFYVMMQFAEAGVKPSVVLKAHQELAENYNTGFPFAQKMVIHGIKTDGKHIYLKKGENTITLDGTKQLNLEIIQLFFKKLEFDDDMLASRFWPLGKKYRIVCDPHHKFGQPVVDGTNIQAETIYKMYQAKEPVAFIASLYAISEEKVRHAIKLFKDAA